MLQISSNSLNYHDLEFTHNSPVEIRKQNTHEEPEGPEHQSKERTVTVFNMTERAWTD
jgi:hypothetical protein